MWWLMTVTDPSDRLTGWRLRLAVFELTMSYKKEADQHHAEALSRPLTRKITDVNGDDDDIPTFLLEIDDNINQSNIKKTSTPTAKFM